MILDYSLLLGIHNRQFMDLSMRENKHRLSIFSGDMDVDQIEEGLSYCKSVSGM